MKAAQWRGPGDLVVTEHPLKEPLPHEAVVRVSFCGLCGSDFEEFDQGPIVATPGVVLGHEITGIVETAAQDGTGPPPGSRVVVDVVTGCGKCRFCLTKEEGLCELLVVTGQHRDGGLAEFVLAFAHRLLTVPDHLPLEHAVFTEPLAVVVRALRKVSLPPESRVLILGGGTIGLMAVQVLRALAVGHISLIEPDQERRAIAGTFGAQCFWDDDVSKRSAWVRHNTHGEGADLILECAGISANAGFGIENLANSGTLLVLGITRKESKIMTLPLVVGEKTIRGSAAHMWNTDCAEALELLASGVVDVAPLVSAQISLDSVVEAFGHARFPQAPLKILVSPLSSKDDR